MIQFREFKILSSQKQEGKKEQKWTFFLKFEKREDILTVPNAVKTKKQGNRAEDDN